MPLITIDQKTRSLLSYQTNCKNSDFNIFFEMLSTIDVHLSLQMNLIKRDQLNKFFKIFCRYPQSLFSLQLICPY